MYITFSLFNPSFYSESKYGKYTEDRRKKNKATEPLKETWLVVLESNRELDDLADRLQTALRRLPQPQREVIAMKIYGQKTFLEISQLLGLSQNTVASRYRYGMEKLRILLENLI